ncbi:MAG TPA: sugar nucleotide-binding protein [Longimicrobium sp.]|nr:sugar nucleotide-binding protein [Longimicrobium sp.]
MTRVLVVGGTGMLGHKLVQVLGADPALEVHATVRRPPPREFAAAAASYHPDVEIAYGSPRLRAVLERLAPDVVVNAAGAIKQKDLYAAVDETFYLNATLPHLLALLNPNPDGRLVHVSTDCTFRGDRGGYTEADPADAEDLYGRSKAAGEVDYGRHLTLRTSIVGPEISGHLSLIGWFLSQPRGSTLPGYTSAIYTGLPTVTLSRTIHRLVRDGVPLSGLYHVASEPVDKCSLLRRVNGALGLGHTLVPDDSAPMDRSLDDTRFREATGTARPGWDELVAEMVEDLRSLPYERGYPALRA